MMRPSRLLDGFRAHPLASPTALRARWREFSGAHEAGTHREHVEAAAAWLCAAQDSTRSGGIARGFSLSWQPYFRSRGWQPAYPETTGYIIPTLYALSDYLGRPELGQRAERASRWEVEVQLPSGAVQGGVVGQRPSPAAFNTGQVMLGWLAAYERAGDPAFEAAARRAGKFLVEMLGDDGFWRTGHSEYAAPNAALYNARTAWALAEAGARLSDPAFTSAAARHLYAVAAWQHPDGWFPECCLSDPQRPLLHTIAYAVRGLLEGGRVLGDPKLVERASRPAAALAGLVREDGWMAGRFGQGWRPAAAWSCLTGMAQMANNWMRLCAITGQEHWLDPVPRVLEFLKRRQDRTSRNPGIRGGVSGSSPLGGEYGRYEILNWATKYFADALVRADRAMAPGAGAPAARDNSLS